MAAAADCDGKTPPPPPPPPPPCWCRDTGSPPADTARRGGGSPNAASPGVKAAPLPPPPPLCDDDDPPVWAWTWAWAWAWAWAGGEGEALRLSCPEPPSGSRKGRSRGSPKRFLMQVSSLRRRLLSCSRFMMRFSSTMSCRRRFSRDRRAACRRDTHTHSDRVRYRVQCRGGGLQLQ